MEYLQKGGCDEPENNSHAYAIMYARNYLLPRGRMRISIVALLVFFSVTVQRAQWEPEQRFTINGTAQPVYSSSISSSSGGLVCVVWSDTRDTNPQVFYKRSTDYGQTWEDEKRFVDTESNAENPGVAIAGIMNSVVHVTWDDDRDGNKEIYYKRSSDWGITWSDDIRLTDSPGASTQPNLHGCVCCGADVRIVWVDERNGNPDIYYKYSDDNGITWSEDIPITADGFLQEHPNLSFCRADVQAAWIDHRSGKPEIWGSHSTDCGMTWSPAILLSQPEHAWAGFATIVHVDSTYHVVWTARIDLSNPPFYSIYYRSTDDLGLSWNPIRRIATHETAYPPLVSCAAMKENVHLAWGIPGQGLFYRRSISSGFTWEGNVCLKDAADVYDPCIAISGKYVHVVWYEKVGKTADIYYMRNLTGNPIGPSE
jgi:hypothetical protein